MHQVHKHRENSHHSKNNKITLSGLTKHIEKWLIICDKSCFFIDYPEAKHYWQGSMSSRDKKTSMSKSKVNTIMIAFVDILGAMCLHWHREG